MKNILICFLISTLFACAQEPVYRGVPAQAWAQLSGEQKQLIVDQSYQSEMQRTA